MYGGFLSNNDIRIPES